MKSFLISGGNFFIFSRFICIKGTHNGFKGFNRLNQALKDKFWDPFFLKVIKHWCVCKVGDELGTSIGLCARAAKPSRAKRGEVRVACAPKGRKFFKREKF